MPLLAENVMQRGVETVAPDLSLDDLEQKLIDEEVGGFAVVDQRGTLCGVVSRSDILRHVILEQSISDIASGFYHDGERVSLPTPASEWLAAPSAKQLADLTVADIMSRDLITAESNEPLLDVARKMNKHRIHRILITDAGRLAGVITAFDFVHAFADGRIGTAHNVAP